MSKDFDCHIKRLLATEQNLYPFLTWQLQDLQFIAAIDLTN
jgi:hypothetical protein